MENISCCLDTDVLIDFLRYGKATEYLLPGQYVSSITAFELLRGAKKGAKKQIVATQGLVASLTTLPFSEETANIASDIIRNLEKKGRPVSNEDVFIAATAIQHKLPLHTRNVKHFESILDLEIF